MKKYRSQIMQVHIILLFLFIFLPRNWAQSIDQLIADGDIYAEKKFDNKKALDVYQKANSQFPNNYEVLWRISRCYIDIGEHQPANSSNEKDAQLKTYNQALDYANAAIKANSNGTMGYLRRAIANGRIALFKGIFSVIGLVKEVKTDLEKAIQLNNSGSHQLAVAHYVLGRTHAKVCDKPYLIRLPLGLGWGDREIAAAEFEKAVQLHPEFIMFHLDAARNYIEMDEYQKAKDHLYKIPRLPIDDEDDDQLKKEAKTLLEEIKSK